MGGRSHLPYSRGTWFAVPLRGGGYSVGIVARMDGDGIVFGYAYGPRRFVVPEMGEVETLGPDDAIWRGQFGDLGLLEGDWPVIGTSSSWKKEDWPLPEFGRVDDLGDKGYRIVYSDNLEVLSEVQCSNEFAANLCPESMYGAVALTIKLDNLLKPRH